MDVIPTAVIFVSRGIVQYANPAALRMFAVRQAGELTGRRLRQWVAPSSRPRFQHLLRQAVRPSYSPVPQEIQIVAADRQVSTVEVTVSRAELPDGSMTQVVLSRLSDPARAEVQAPMSLK